MVRAGTLMPVEEYLPLLREFVAQAGQRHARPLDKIRVVYEGAFCEQPPIDFILTNYLAAFGIADYQGTKVVDYTQNYAKVPHYELSILRIAYTALWLANQGLMSGEDAIALLTKLMNDGKADLAAKLSIEDVLYNSKRLD